MGLHLRGRRLSPVAQIVGVVAMTASAEPELRYEITCPRCGYRKVEESRRTHPVLLRMRGMPCLAASKERRLLRVLLLRCRARPSNLSR